VDDTPSPTSHLPTRCPSDRPVRRQPHPPLAHPPAAATILHLPTRPSPLPIRPHAAIPSNRLVARGKQLADLIAPLELARPLVGVARASTPTISSPDPCAPTSSTAFSLAAAPRAQQHQQCLQQQQQRRPVGAVQQRRQHQQHSSGSAAGNQQRQRRQHSSKIEGKRDIYVFQIIFHLNFNP
jgi:hypothetical protein